MSKKVAVIMGSDSDLPIVKQAVQKLKEFNVPFEVHVMSAHRTPEDAAEFSKHLGGVLAAHTTLPVIGIPIKSSTLDGLDALLSTVQMPSGIPVATVAIDGAVNAAILAVQILALTDKELSDKLVDMKKQMSESVKAKDKKISQEINNLI